MNDRGMIRRCFPGPSKTQMELTLRLILFLGRCCVKRTKTPTDMPRLKQTTQLVKIYFAISATISFAFSALGADRHRLDQILGETVLTINMHKATYATIQEQLDTGMSPNDVMGILGKPTTTSEILSEFGKRVEWSYLAMKAASETAYFVLPIGIVVFFKDGRLSAIKPTWVRQKTKFREFDTSEPDLSIIIRYPERPSDLSVSQYAEAYRIKQQKFGPAEMNELKLIVLQLGALRDAFEPKKTIRIDADCDLAKALVRSFQEAQNWLHDGKLNLTDAESFFKAATRSAGEKMKESE